MLSRFISRPSNIRFLALISSKSHFSNPNSHTRCPNPVFTYLTRHFSNNNNNDDNNNKNHSSSSGGSWNLSSQDDSIESIFKLDTEVPAQGSATSNINNNKGLSSSSGGSWNLSSQDDESIFKLDTEVPVKGSAASNINNNKGLSSSSGGSWNLSSQDDESIFKLDTDVPAQGSTTININNNKGLSSSSGGSWNLSSQDNESIFGLDTEVPAQGSAIRNIDNNKGLSSSSGGSWNLSSQDNESIFGLDNVVPAQESATSNNNNFNKDRSSSSGGSWNLSSQDDSIGSVFRLDTEIPAQGSEIKDDSWLSEPMGNGDNDGWNTAEGFTPWNLNEDKGGEEKFFDDGIGDQVNLSRDMIALDEEKARLEKEEQTLFAVLEGPKRAFGDLIESSGITDEMLDSLMALKDLEGIEGLPSLSEIEDLRYQKNSKRSSRADIERQKQEEVANARVRKVDNKGRAYGTGRRKCSIARVWIEPGEGNFVINEKQFDVYFPMLDQRAALLRPFTETKTLGQWDIKCTVKGGGYTGQVGAIRLGISRALQNWEPEMRRPLKAAGFMTRDPRVVERKKPGKAKARKSFQWVKR